MRAIILEQCTIAHDYCWALCRPQGGELHLNSATATVKSAFRRSLIWAEAYGYDAQSAMAKPWAVHGKSLHGALIFCQDNPPPVRRTAQLMACWSSAAVAC